ncbi:gamma-butyrobetaine hydroxylase-like domain-containing protein [Comamonas jiangduensis]|uniref:gamma-butyrobetaine hydroxylase-like domain-containing protein n=1 Tax=Comamonas jiangduensis TaxID=1194168 RepID=UPI003BF7DA87
MADMPLPQSLTVHAASRVLEVGYSDGKNFRLPFELMRVYSPSAEVQGHGPGQEVLQTGKRDVTIANIEQVGNYAIKPFFSDGHESGLFTWNYLYELGEQQDQLWATYLARLEAAGVDRDTPMPEKAGGSCGTGGGCGSGSAAAPASGGGCGSGSCGCSS